jgi:hypothetical protein
MPAPALRVLNPTNNSYSLIICDNILARLKQLPFFVNFKFGRSKQFPLIPENIPYCAVYFVSENAGPDGLANSGPPKFSISTRVGFSIWIRHQDPDQTVNQLDGAFRAIMRGLLEYPIIYNDATAPVEGFSAFTRRHSYGNAGLNNEQPVAEMQLELTCFYREYYEFVPVDDFRIMHLETRYPTADTDPAEVQQIVAVWDIPQ